MVFNTFDGVRGKRGIPAGTLSFVRFHIFWGLTARPCSAPEVTLTAGAPPEVAGSAPEGALTT